MAGADRRCRPHTDAERYRNADKNDGSNDGRMGRAAQAAESDERLAVGDAVQTEVLAWLRSGRQLAEPGCLPDGGDEPLAVLDAIHGAVAEILGRYGHALDQGREAALKAVDPTQEATSDQLAFPSIPPAASAPPARRDIPRRSAGRSRRRP